MNNRPELYHQLLQLAHELSQSVTKGKVVVDNQDAGYSSDNTDVDDYFLTNAVAIVDLTLFDKLPAHACKYLLGIIKQMKRNNVFFITAGATANERRSLASLKRANILITTERRELYIINPFKLRRGKPLATIMASLHHYHKDNSIFKLEDLRPPKKSHALLLN